MDPKTKTEPVQPAPDPERVQQRAAEAMRAISEAQSRIHQDVAELEGERRRLETQSDSLSKHESELAGRQKVCEQRREELDKERTHLERRRSELEAAVAQLEVDRKMLARRHEEMQGMSARLAEQQEAQGRAADSVAQREHAVALLEQKLTHHGKELEVQALEFKQREADIASRMRQFESDAAELATARETVFTMQAQLERDHHEVASQREELLERLGVTPPRPAPGPSHGRRAASERMSAWRPTDPKPAAIDGAEQFRKLRRDSKRKAIGV